MTSRPGRDETRQGVMKAHVEVIGPLERLHPDLGGTGYLPPREPSGVEALMVDLERSASHDFNLGMSVWKVARRSVSWGSGRMPRRLGVYGCRIPCDPVGGTRDWWFVAVKCGPALRLLKRHASPKGSK